MKQKYFAFAFCVLIFTAGIVVAFSGGPPDGRTGAPGESNCSVSCHSTFPLNSGNGILTINAPATYEPNGGAFITVNLSQAGQSRWGFEATVLDANDNWVGFFMDDDPNRTQITNNVSREYVKHTFLGTDAGVANASLGWSFIWMAPNVNVGPVTIYVAGNAANNNNFNSGDFIYTTSFTIQPAPSNCCVDFRGNVDDDNGDTIDISDLVFLVSFMFSGGTAPPCTEEADIDGSGDIDISDLVGLVAFMFSGGLPPTDCP